MRNPLIKYAYLLLVIGCLALAGCYRAVPKPGDANIVGVPHPVIAQSYLIGKTMYLTVEKGVGQDTRLANKQFRIEFVLPTDYALYHGHHHDKFFLVSSGNYEYEIDYYRLRQSRLNLEGKNGWNMRLIYTGDYEGYFYAEPNVPNGNSSFHGRFIIQ